MNIITLKTIFSFVISFLFTYYLVPLCIKIARSMNILDLPDGRIKIHKSPTPYLGGVAIYAGFIITLAIILPFDMRLGYLLLGSTILLMVGLIDDLLKIKPYQKLCGQLIAALCYVKVGLYIKEGFFLNNFWHMPAAIFWITLIINAFNLVDVMDGLATVIAAHATLGFLIVALLSQDLAIAILLATLLGSLIAFFYYNKPVAQIYLGDAGSLFIGGALAVVPFFMSWGQHSALGFITPLFFLAIPIIEVVCLIIIRTYKGIPFYLGSPDHYCLYLKRRGWHVSQVLLFTGCASLFSMAIGICNFYGIFMPRDLALIGVIFGIIWSYIVFISSIQSRCTA